METRIPEPPKSILLFFCMMCTVPSVYGVIFSVVCGLFTFAEFFRCLMSLKVPAYLAVIFDLAKTVKTQEESVMGAMNAQNAGSSQIIEAMKSIDDSTISVKQGAGEMKTEGKTVLAEIQSLEQTSSSVFEFVDQMLSGTDSIEESIRAGNESSARNGESIRSLEQMTMKFKVEA